METTIVAKFGGTSITNLGYSSLIDKLLKDFPNKKIVCVLSAQYGVTKDLISQFDHKIAVATSQQNSTITSEELYLKCLKEYDLMISQGETNSILEACITAKSKGIDAIALTGQQAGIQSNANHGAAAIEHVSTNTLRTSLDDHSIVFVAGFQGVSSSGFITTLGRGSSDLTAIALASALGLSDVYIYTDVPAIYSSDPRKVDSDKLKVISIINFEEALELASFGGKVIHDRAVSLAQKHGTRIHIRDSGNPSGKSGTVICSKYEAAGKKNKSLLKACISREDISLFSVKLPNKPGLTEKITQALSNKEVKLCSMFQNYSQNESYLEFVVSADEAMTCERELSNLKNLGAISGFKIDKNLSEISAIGAGLEHAHGFIAYFEELFNSRNIETHSLYTNGIRISALIETTKYHDHFQDIYLDLSSYI